MISLNEKWAMGDDVPLFGATRIRKTEKNNEQ